MLAPSSAGATQLTGIQLNRYLNFSEVIPSFDVDLGEGVISTGDIQLTLDPTDNFYLSFDFDTMAMKELPTVRASSSYLTAQGIPFLRLNGDADGSITSPVPDLIDDGSFQPYSVISNMIGVAFTEPGAPLDFAIAWNGRYAFSTTGGIIDRNSPPNFVSAAVCDVKTGDNININTFFSVFAGGFAQSINVTSTGSGSTCVPSVPGPLPLLGVGAAFGYSRRLRKQIKTSKTQEVMSAIG